MAKGSIRIALVDKQPIARLGLVQLLKNWPPGQVVVHAANGIEYEKASSNEPRIHLTILELDMEGRDGFDTMRWIKRSQPRTLAMVLTDRPTDADVAKAVECDARAILCKTAGEDLLLKAVDNVVRTGFHRCERMAKYMLHPPTRSPAVEQCIRDLTPKEYEFLMLYATEPYYTLKEIAVKMGRRCVESLRSLVCKRIGCKRQAEMIHFVSKHREALEHWGRER